MTAKISRPLNDAERDLMSVLAILTVSTQSGAAPAIVAEALDLFAAEGRSVLSWDDENAWLEIAESPIVHAKRDWLAFYAHARDWEADRP